MCARKARGVLPKEQQPWSERDQTNDDAEETQLGRQRWRDESSYDLKP
jgi:hypothetical protein